MTRSTTRATGSNQVPSLRDAAERVLQRIAEALSESPPESLAASALRRGRKSLDHLIDTAEALEARYRGVLDAVPDAVTVHALDGTILDANRTASTLYGYPLDVLKGMGLAVLNPDLPPDHMQRLRPTFKVGSTHTVETWNTRGDGSRFPVEVHSNVYLDGDERRIVAVARDITRRRVVETQLRSSEERYRRLLASLDQGLLVHDPNGRVIGVNAAAERLLGADENALVREDPRGQWSFVDADGRLLRGGELPALRALASGQSVANTVIGVSSPHLPGVRWFAVTAVPQFLDDEAQPFQAISLFTDVTALKRQSELFEETQRLARIGGWERNLNRDALFLTAEMFRLLELPVGDPLDWAGLLRYFHPSDAARFESVVASLRSGGHHFDLELRVTTARHHERWLRVLGHPQMHRGRVDSVSGTMQDITAGKLAEEQLRRQALTDALTGLANRDALLAEMQDAQERAALQGPSLLYIDLDRFKMVNDLLGHAAGDGLLVAAASRLRSVVGDRGLLARFGGDEFMVLLPASTGSADADALAERITQNFVEPFRYGGEEFSLTASVGIALWPEGGASVQQLINHADAAMLEAKRRGRNQWQRFSPQLERRLTERLMIETQLRRALDHGEFHLKFQPQVNLADRSLVGAEALLRWNSRMLGELTPDVFIPHAENTGDIVRIGAWVIRQTLRQMRDWRDAGVPIPRIAVNVSYRQFVGEGLVDMIGAALNEAGLPGDVLELELTERVLIDDIADTMSTFEALKGLGVRLVIDDFGEGYSALGYLRRLPFDGLKISHGFLRDIPANRPDTAICLSIISIAKNLGLDLVAEGVENEQQREFLLSHGTRYAQGYLFSRPLSPREFAEFARRFGVHS